MKKKILFRADGNQYIGLGHLYRLFAMVEMLKEAYDLCFVTKESSVVSIIPKEYKVCLIPHSISYEDEPAWLFDNFLPTDHIIIADCYNFTSGYQKHVKELGYKLVYVDDLASEKMYADIVINHAPNISVSNYLHNGASKFALGVKYVLLRPKFLQAAKEIRKIDSVKKAFVCFGGADPLDLSLKATKALLQFQQIEKIHVVLGAANTKGAITGLQDDFPDKVEIHKNLGEEELIKIMKLCDIGIAPASTIIYEVCCIKMLVLGGYYVQNQQKIYEGLVAGKVIYPAGNFERYTISDFAEKVEAIVKDALKNNYLNAQKQLFDGRSGLRILGLVNALQLNFRKAKEEDLTRIFQWSNDKTVRKNSYNPEAIGLQEHTIWYKNKLKDKNTLFLVININDDPAGVVRYQVEDQHAVVGIMIDPKFRGQNLAVPFLTATAKEYFCTFDKPVLAFIKTSNIGSVKSFEKAGYYKVAETLIEKQKSFIYKLEQKDAIG